MKSVETWNEWTMDIFNVFGNNLNDGKIFCELVPDALNGDDEGWVNPTSFDQVFLPKDLPRPSYQPALGLVLQKGGMLRYIMPSIILNLKTADRDLWRNRGLKTSSRARCWLDAYSEYGGEALNSNSLHLSYFSADNIAGGPLKFLEDQDGASHWRCLSCESNMEDDGGKSDIQKLFSQSLETVYKSNGDRLQCANGWAPRDKCLTYNNVLAAYEAVQQVLLEGETKLGAEVFSQLQDGYHFLDIPLPFPSQGDIGGTTDRANKGPRRLPIAPIKSFLCDFEEPYKLLEVDEIALPSPTENARVVPLLEGVVGTSDLSGVQLSKFKEEWKVTHMSSLLESEPCAELFAYPTLVNAGGDSAYLPEVYKSLYEEGSVIE